MERFPAARALGLEINPRYAARARAALEGRGLAHRADVVEKDFFTADWASLLAALPEPLLVIGNPPWVTNSALGALRSSNLPEKNNFQGHVGLDAVTGKSNFDISEWMLIRLLESLEGRSATLAMLCKTATARKVLLHSWKNQIALGCPAIHGINAARSFGVAVDACLFVCSLGAGGADAESRLPHFCMRYQPEAPARDLAGASGSCDGGRNLHAETEEPECPIYPELGKAEVSKTIGFRDGRLVADAAAFDRLRHLQGEDAYRWRSGIKHDCGKVMEFLAEDGRYRNGLGDLATLEDSYLYPMLKGSEVASLDAVAPTRWMLVTQRHPGEETGGIAERAPQTWEYLQSHARSLDKRASSIYRKRPQFSVFGVGDYTFAPWKVAVSGLHKGLQFRVSGPVRGKPVVFDDTCYFIAAYSAEEADLLARLLRSDLAADFYNSLIFWDAKRPITAEVLGQLGLRKLAAALGEEKHFASFLAKRGASQTNPGGQLELFACGRNAPICYHSSGRLQTREPAAGSRSGVHQA